MGRSTDPPAPACGGLLQSSRHLALIVSRHQNEAVDGDLGALVDDGTKMAYLMNVAVPEPALMALLAVPFGGLLMRRRRHLAQEA